MEVGGVHKSLGIVVRLEQRRWTLDVLRVYREGKSSRSHNVKLDRARVVAPSRAAVTVTRHRSRLLFMYFVKNVLEKA